MLAVECVFYPEEFILRNQIDYKTIYLSKYYNPLRLKQVTFYENQDSLAFITDNDDEDEDKFQKKYLVEPTIEQFVSEAIHTTTISEDRLLKCLFHGVRYLDIGEQLIRTKSIYDFKRASYVLFEMKEIYVNNDKNMDCAIDYIRMKGDEYKQTLDELLPITYHINGMFKVDITVGTKSEQLITSTIHDGSYPTIVDQMKTLIDEKYQDCHTIRLQIKSLISNESVPASDIDKLLFWDKKSNYFQFNYKIHVKSKHQLKTLQNLCLIRGLLITTNKLKKSADDPIECTVIMRVFNMGKIRACDENNHVIGNLTYFAFPPVEIESYFVVYDSNIDLDNRLKPYVKPVYSETNIRPKYRIGCKARKAFQRSADMFY